MAINAGSATSKQGFRHTYNTRYGGARPAKRKSDGDSWEELEERGKRRRRYEDDRCRRKDSVTHLISSIYADLEAAVDLQRRITEQGKALTDEERFQFETNEDLRLDHLLELRLAALLSHQGDQKLLKAARLPRGRRFDHIRAALKIVSAASRVQRRLSNRIVGTLGWTVIAICLHSSNFRARFLEATDAVDFEDRLDQLRHHKESIEFFAKSRLFDWLEENADQQAQDVLIRDLHCLLTGIAVPESQDITDEEAKIARLHVETRIVGFPDDGKGVDHPHEWELSADGRIATRLGFLPGGRKASLHLQTNIIESEVLLRGHRWNGRSKWLLPEEPRYRSRYDDDCTACNRPGDGEGKKWRANCQCTLQNLKIRLAADGAYFGDRVELRNIHPVIGTGVRALQHVPAGSLLAEYVGEIYPINKKNRRGIYKRPTYLFCQQRVLSHGNENAMFIDPSIRGNWTRYINHSCKPKTNFMMYPCGQKTLTCITVRDRPIEFGEEITVSYGRDYFLGQKLACRCGEDICTLWNADKTKDNKMTLLEAKQQGTAPDWAR